MILKILITVLYIGLSLQYLHYPTPYTDDTGEKVEPIVIGVGNTGDSCTKANFSYNYVYQYGVHLSTSLEYSQFQIRKYCKSIVIKLTGTFNIAIYD